MAQVLLKGSRLADFLPVSRHLYDEMSGAEGAPRPHYQGFSDWLKRTPVDQIAQKREEAERAFHRIGITFAVYGENGGTERLIPFDIVPRIIPASEWRTLERGLKQRVHALNLFLDDIYHDQSILKAGVIPPERVLANSQYRREMQGMDVPGGIYAHIAGVDIVRADEGSYYVLEDNLRTPSGVSYMLENRKMMMRLFPELFARQHVHPVEHYPGLLLETLRASAPPQVRDPVIAVLTPGQHNSAYFEHAFLAQQMGVELVEGMDLFVKDGYLHMRTTGGPQRVDVVYRRIDDAFLDPLAFRQDSLLGVPGLLSVYRAGNVSLANAIGTGVADDKSTYPYVPDMIRFYLGEEPILQNVPTWQCKRPQDLALVLERLPELVVKEVQGSGGYGMLIGPAAKKAEIEAFRARLLANPANYIAQLTLSRVAERVFWMSRQMERAENMARILGVTSNVLLLGSKETREQNLMAPLSIIESEEAFFERHKQLTEKSLIEFLALDETNPASIYSCLKWARENAHAARWQITSEMWETLNATWIEMRAIKRDRVTGAGATEFFDWVKDRSHLFCGVTYSTIVRGEAFNFSRLGTFLERADNTERILDVKYHILMHSDEEVGGAV